MLRGDINNVWKFNKIIFDYYEIPTCLRGDCEGQIFSLIYSSFHCTFKKFSPNLIITPSTYLNTRFIIIYLLLLGLRLTVDYLIQKLWKKSWRCVWTACSLDVTCMYLHICISTLNVQKYTYVKHHLLKTPRISLNSSIMAIPYLKFPTTFKI